MIIYLMNSDLPVLKIDLEISDEKIYINDIDVLCNDMLPYELKDYVISAKFLQSTYIKLILIQY